jgi:signal transduction histidine kinase
VSERTETKILVVDDEPAIADGVAEMLMDLGYTVTARCTDASGAIEAAREKLPSIALVDIRLHGEESGIELANLLRTELGIPVVFMTAFADQRTIARATRACAAGCLLKPLTAQDLECAIEIVVARHHMVTREASTERLAAASRVAEGLSHEINNPLTYVSSNLELALEALANVERDPTNAAARLAKIRTALNEAKEGADRVRSIVTDITTFAAQAVPAPVPVDLTTVLRAAWAIACGDARDAKRWELDVPVLPAIEGDEVQLVQLFTRLLQNAVQYPRAGRTHQVHLRATADDRSITVVIRDNGRGIPRDIQRRVFDPFFTTRGARAGRGLGLAIAAGVVRAHLGEITLESTPDVGTTVKVVLPCSQSVRPTGIGIASPPAVTKARPRVLVIDDEPAIARSIQRMLQKEYDVRSVGDGPTALAELASAPYDAILCDVTLPGMLGTEVFTEIERRYPPLAERVVFVTGGAFGGRIQAFLDSLPNKTIRKPFAVEEIRSTLREMLGSDQRRGK